MPLEAAGDGRLDQKNGAMSAVPSWSNVTSIPVVDRHAGGPIGGQRADDPDRAAHPERPSRPRATPSSVAKDEPVDSARRERGLGRTVDMRSVCTGCHFDAGGRHDLQPPRHVRGGFRGEALHDEAGVRSDAGGVGGAPGRGWQPARSAGAPEAPMARLAGELGVGAGARAEARSGLPAAIGPGDGAGPGLEPISRDAVIATTATAATDQDPSLFDEGSDASVQAAGP